MKQVADFLKKLFDSSDWPPRWHCGNWTEFHGWLYIISDLLIWSAYFTIPIVIIRYISRKKNIRFTKLYFLFAAFILACGATHFLDAVAFWIPVYRLSALVRFITGVISWVTVFYLVKNLPVFFSLKTQESLEAEIEQRKRSEEKFRGLLEAAPDALVIANEKGEIVLINRQTEKLFGYAKEELIGKPVEILIPASLHHNHIKHREKYTKDPHVRSMGAGIELEAVKKDGSKFPVEISLSPLVTEGGTLISASVRDIYERKKTEEKLNKAKSYFQLLLNSVKDYAIFMLDTEGRVANWNSGAENIKGYTAAEIIGQPTDVFYTQEDQKLGVPKKNLEQALQHGHFEGEGWRLRKDGTNFWADVVVTPLFDEKEQLYGYAKVTRDITEKKKADERIRFLASIASNIQDPFISTDNNGNITRWNHAAELLLEWKTDEVIGKKAAALLQVDYLGISREMIFKLLDEKNFWQGEVIYHTKSGRPVNVLITASRLKDNQDNNIGSLALVRDITERKKAEEKLKEFEHFFNNSNDFSCIANVEGYFEIVNSSFNKILGYSQNELATKPFLDFVHPDDIAKTLEVYEKLKSGATLIHFINRYRKVDGSYLLFDWNATPNPVSGKLYCIARDITERKKAEDALNKLNEELEQKVIERTEKLAASEMRFRMLIENSAEGIDMSDEFSNNIYRSPGAVKISGFLPKENQMGLTHPDDLETIKSKQELMIKNPGIPVPFQARFRHALGHYLWIEGTLTNLLHVEGVHAFVTNFRDITQRKELEVLLHKANTLARIGGWELDLVKGTVFWSDITREIHETEHDYEPDLQNGINFYKEGPGRDLIAQKVKEAIEFCTPWDLELQIITAKNNERWIRTIGETEFADGKCIRLYGSFQDITERKKAEEEIKKLNIDLEEKVIKRTQELKNSNEELEAFSYSVSHDLRTPLRAVNGYARILEEDYNDIFDDEGKRLLGEVQNNAKKMGALIDDLLAFSRLGRKEVEKSFIDTNKLVELAIREINQTTIHHAEIKVSQLLPVMADYTLLQQVMINLISNAVKYSSKKPNPVVEISSQKSGEENIYSVSDNGAGFDMDYGHKLFGVFQRLHSTDEFSGTGVGLAIVQRIIQKHNGKIWAEGKVGEGATFYFSLPGNL